MRGDAFSQLAMVRHGGVVHADLGELKPVAHTRPELGLVLGDPRAVRAPDFGGLNYPKRLAPLGDWRQRRFPTLIRQGDVGEREVDEPERVRYPVESGFLEDAHDALGREHATNLVAHSRIDERERVATHRHARLAEFRARLRVLRVGFKQNVAHDSQRLRILGEPPHGVETVTQRNDARVVDTSVRRSHPVQSTKTRGQTHRTDRVRPDGDVR